MEYDLLTLGLSCVFICLIFTLATSAIQRPANFPPGPPSLPIIGSYPFLSGPGIERLFGAQVCSYGPITGLYVGSYPVVILNDWPLAKALFAKEEFAGRINNYTTNWARSLTGESLGIAMTDGRRWSSQRNFTVKHLKNFGFGKKDLEVVIQREALSLVNHLIDSPSKELEVSMSIFAVPVLNVLWEMVAGHAFQREDVEVQRILKMMNWVFTSKVFAVAMMFPWVRFIFPNLTGYNKRLETLKAMRGVFREEIRQHKEEIDYNNPRDLIDSYLVEMRTGKEKEFHEEQLIMIGLDLMGAGADTTSATLIWVFLFLSLNPLVQERCYKEATACLGEATVSLVDLPSLNYCQATIAEVQRMSKVAVSSLQHRVTRNVELPTGHVLPEGTIAMTNISRFLSDPMLWESPEEFNPQRFLDENGKFFRPDHFVPLGHGRRVCMGEPLAKAELAIFFVTIVQKLQIVAISGEEGDPHNYSMGITRVPNPFKVALSVR